MEEIVRWLAGRATNAPGRHAVRVTAPGAIADTIYEDGDVRITAKTTTEITGRRHLASRAPALQSPIVTQITGVTTSVVEVTNKSGDRLLVTGENGQTCWFPQATAVVDSGSFVGTDWCAIPSGSRVAIESWRDGKRVGGATTTMAAAKVAARKTDLSAFADYAFELADGTPLVLNVTSTFGFATYDFVYERETRKNAGVEDSVVTELATPTFGLPPGKYSIRDAHDTFTVEIGPTGVVHGGIGKQRVRLKLFEGGGWKFWAVSSNGFTPEHPQLYPDGNVYMPRTFTGALQMTAADRL